MKAMIMVTDKSGGQCGCALKDGHIYPRNMMSWWADQPHVPRYLCEEPSDGYAREDSYKPIDPEDITCPECKRLVLIHQLTGEWPTGDEG